MRKEKYSTVLLGLHPALRVLNPQGLVNGVKCEMAGVEFKENRREYYKLIWWTLYQGEDDDDDDDYDEDNDYGDEDDEADDKAYKMAKKTYW